MKGASPAPLRALCLLAALHVRRTWNRQLWVLQRQAGKADARQASGRKQAGVRAVARVLMGLIVILVYWRSMDWMQRATEAGEPLSGAAGALAVLFVGLLATALGTPTGDLLHAARRTEWLSTFPIRSGTLLLARAGAYGLGHGWGWLAIGPLLLAVYWHTRPGLFAVAAAVLVTLLLQALHGALLLSIEVLSARLLDPARLGNLRALCQVLGAVRPRPRARPSHGPALVAHDGLRKLGAYLRVSA